MQKEDWIWLAIRIFGIYLLILAATAVPSIISNMVGLFAYAASPPPAGSSADNSMKELLSNFAWQHVVALIRCVADLLLYGVAGIHLLRGGKLIYRLMQAPESAAITAENTRNGNENA